MLLNRTRADALMDRDGIAAIIASSAVNTYYLSSWATDASWGFGDIALAVLPRNHDLEAAVHTVEIDTGQPQQGSGTWMRIVRGYARRSGIGAGGVQGVMTSQGLPQNHPEAIAAYLAEIGLANSRIAFDDLGLGQSVKAKLGGIKVVPARELIRDIRMIKTAEEVSHLRAAGRKTSLALEVSAEALAAGATCAEAERTFHAAASAIGGKGKFLLITPYRPGTGRLEKNAALLPGDCVTFDATAEFAHYTSDIGRTAVIGEPSADQLRCYNAIRNGWQAALHEFREGQHSTAVEKAVTTAIQLAGNPEFRGCSIHSVGLEHTDHPHPDGGLHHFDLAEGMVLSCDLPWIGPNIGKFHYEDLVWIGPNGPELLNETDPRLISCIDGRTQRVG
ncbi:M24 family metallopeptidase [Novosphingobium sp.]|uniref:M24 family metallopeptidase n=1 Tax=Novosphingobium sp. TaxID=1874826 RepID=UPI00286E5859|nr:M24 family metallopeptidase [Novosphingobium sp.]